MTTDTPSLSDMLLEITRGHAEALKADPTLAARLDAQNGTGLPALNAETVCGNKPGNSLLAAGALNRVSNEPGLRVHEAEIALARAVRAMAQWLVDGGLRAELTDGPEWRQLRALYLHYCNGVEDALYDKTAVLAAAIRDGKAAWVGDIVLDAWNSYADAALIERVEAKAAELRR